MKPVLMGLSVLTLLAAGQQAQKTFTGLVTDEMCPTGSHAHMKMGAADADCTRACIAAHGSRYVLYDGKSAYVLSDQQAPEPFAAQKVRVTGTLDEKTMTIHVASIGAAK